MAAKEPAKPLDWKPYRSFNPRDNWHTWEQAEVEHGTYLRPRHGSPTPRKIHYYAGGLEGDHHMVGLKGAHITSQNPAELGHIGAVRDLWDRAPEHESHEKLNEAIEHHHAAKHYGLDRDDIEAVHAAWPQEGPRRFLWMHPDQVKHELTRAHGLEKSEAKDPAEPLMWSKREAFTYPDLGHMRTAQGHHGFYRQYSSPGGKHQVYFYPRSPAQPGRVVTPHGKSTKSAYATGEDQGSEFDSEDAAQLAASHHHAAQHYGLSYEDIDSTHRAWPAEGPRRFIGMHPDQVKHELTRAHGLEKSAKPKGPAEPLKFGATCSFGGGGPCRGAIGSGGQEYHVWPAEDAPKDRPTFRTRVTQGGMGDTYLRDEPTEEKARAGASDHHAARHYGLSEEDVKAVHSAWPDEGPRRFIGMHPDQVRHELTRAHGLDKSLSKSLKDHEVAVRHHAARAAIAHAVGDYAGKRKHANLATSHARRLTRYAARKAFNEGRQLAGKLSQKNVGESHPADRLVGKMKKSDFGAEANQSTPTLGEPMQTSLTGNGDPVLSDPKVKRFLQQLGTKMVSAQFGDAFKPGDRVVHPYLGMGKVIRVHDPSEADEEAGLLYDIRYPEFDIALNQMELMAVPPPPVNPLSVPIKANMRAAIPTAPPHPALQALVSMAPNMAAVAQTQQEEKEAQMEAMAQGADAEGGAEGEEGGDAEGGSDDAPPFGKSEALTKAAGKPVTFRWRKHVHGTDGDEIYPGEVSHHVETDHGDYTIEPDVNGKDVWYQPKGSRFDQHAKHLGSSVRHSAAKKLVYDHHAKQHFGLKDHEVAAVNKAWPEGTKRLVHMHPDQVKHEIARATEAFGEDDPLGKAKTPEVDPLAKLVTEVHHGVGQSDEEAKHGPGAYFIHNQQSIIMRDYATPYGTYTHIHDEAVGLHDVVHQDNEGRRTMLTDTSEHSRPKKKDVLPTIRRHVLRHYGLKEHEAKAVQSAWPDQGVHRFHGMHPDQVKHEVARATEAFPPDPLGKARAKAILPAKKPKANISKPLKFAPTAAPNLHSAHAKHGRYFMHESGKEGGRPHGFDVGYSRSPGQSTHLGWQPTRDAALSVANNHHAIMHHDLTLDQVAATHKAWPEEGPARFHGMHPDQVKHELGRAMEHYEGLGKSEAAKESKSLRWREDGGVRHAETDHGHYWMARVFTAYDGRHHWEPRYRPGATTRPVSMSSTHQEYHPVNDASPSYGNRKAGEAAALRHHVTKHYGLKQHEVAAVKHAWPEGVTRFHGMHPDMVRHEVGRALEAHPPETVEKSKKPKNPKLLAENAKIKENAAKPENQVAHNFKGAEWTTGNGHPRCLRCGDEEPISGKCSPRA